MFWPGTKAASAGWSGWDLSIARSALNRAQWSYVWDPPGGWGGPHSIGPRRAVLDAAKGGCCRDLVGSHRKVVQKPQRGEVVVKPNTARWGGLDIKKWSRSHREGRPNTAGGLGEAGSVLPSKSGPESPLCILLVVIYWRKYVHEVLVNRLGGLSLPRKSVVRLTDRPVITLEVYRGSKTTIQQQQYNKQLSFEMIRKIIFTNYFSACIHQVAIKFRFRNALHKKCFQYDISRH